MLPAVSSLPCSLIVVLVPDNNQASSSRVACGRSLSISVHSLSPGRKQYQSCSFGWTSSYVVLSVARGRERFAGVEIDFNCRHRRPPLL